MALIVNSENLSNIKLLKNNIRISGIKVHPEREQRKVSHLKRRIDGNASSEGGGGCP